jgi:hypothetical protein
MKTSKFLRNVRALSGMVARLLLAAAGCATCQAYDTYSEGCINCHGAFNGPTSTKGTVFPSGSNHEMHRGANSMATACNLCHTGTNPPVTVHIGSSIGTANNPGLGCTGCHVGAGLRAHHLINNVTECLDCHDAEVSPAENVSPPYYGTADTRVRNPGNDVLAANTNENWSVGDFIGLDNDGNNLYDLADYAIGPFRLLSVGREGDNIRVTWLTAGGRTDAVLASRVAPGPYLNAVSPFAIAGVGLVTTNYLDVGGATNPARYYRLRGLLP